MAMSHDVELPASREPEFPKLCVGCSAADPATEVEVTTRRIGWWTVVFWMFGAAFSVSFPACDDCVDAIRAQSFRRTVARWVFSVTAVAGAIYVFGEIEGPWRRWLLMIAALLFLLPLMVFEIFLAPIVDMTAKLKTVDYEFKNADYADEFAEINDAEVA